MICDSRAVLFRLLRNSVYSLHMCRFRCFDVLESIYNSWNSFAQSLFPLPTPRGLALLESERILYISDAGNHQIRRLDLETGDLSSPAPEAFFQSPAGLAYNDLNKFLYVSDSATHAVYRLNLTEDSPMPVVVAGRPHHPGGPGDGSTFISPSVEGKLNRPDGLALDVIGQRLFIGDSTKAIRVVDLITETMTLAAVRSSFQHESGHLGPIGIALGNTTVPGFIVESIWHNPLIGGPPQFGNYFYFQSSKGYASGDLKDFKDIKSIKPNHGDFTIFQAQKALGAEVPKLPLAFYAAATIVMASSCGSGTLKGL